MLLEEFNEAEEMAFTENAFTDFIKKAFQAIIKLFERAKDFILRLQMLLFEKIFSSLILT